MIELKRITKCHRTHNVETTALDAIDLQIEAGEYVAITGPSGCGKSTLLGVLGLLDTPTSGQYLLQGEDVARKTAREMAAIRRGRIGFVFQSFNLVDELNVWDNVQLALRYGELPEKNAASARNGSTGTPGSRTSCRAPSESAQRRPAAACRNRARDRRAPCPVTSRRATV